MNDDDLVKIHAELVDAGVTDIELMRLPDPGNTRKRMQLAFHGDAWARVEESAHWRSLKGAPDVP